MLINRIGNVSRSYLQLDKQTEDTNIYIAREYIIDSLELIDSG